MKILATFYLIAMATSPIIVHAQTANAISIELDEKILIKRCEPGAVPRMGTTVSQDELIGVRVRIQGKSKGTELKYEVTGGKVKGSGQTIEWDLTDMESGTYRITATQYLFRKPIASNTALVKVEDPECISDCSCPAFDIVGPTEPVKDGTLQEFVANYNGPPVAYKWSIENGEIISGQGTSKLTVRVNKKNSSNEMTVAVERGDQMPSCNCVTIASVTVQIKED